MRELVALEVTLYSIALRITRDESLSWDVLQQIYENFSKLSDSAILAIKSLRAYAVAAARNQAFLQLRVAKRCPIDFIEDLKDLPDYYLDDWRQDLGAVIEADEALTRLLFEIYERLPPQCRKIVILTKILKLTSKEVSVRLGIAERTVKNQLQLATKYAKATLNRRGVSQGALLLLQLLQRKG